MIDFGDSERGIVISLCDLTGNMVRPWAEAGYVCYCVDIQHPIRNPRIEEVGQGRIIYQWGDVRSWTPPPDIPIRIIFAFPPCTDLAVSGARDFLTKRGYRLSDALELFDACQLAAEYSRAPYMIENPKGRLNTHRRPPDFTFDPCDFGGYLADDRDAYTKFTCLWVGGAFVFPTKKPIEPVKQNYIRDLPQSPDRKNIRSETPMGFAQAVFESNSRI